jgi:hypothetical protein
MYWPRLILTPEEEKWSTKYFDPTTNRRGVLRRIYQGSLEINETQRNPIWNFQIARRCRVFGLTGIGDVDQLRMQFQDASGEQYYVNPILGTQVFGGWAASGLQPTLPNLNTPQRSVGLTMYLCPFIFEPNIVLRPNQVLNIIGEPVLPYAGQAYRIDLAIHVWEFPNYPNDVDADGCGVRRTP